MAISFKASGSITTSKGSGCPFRRMEMCTRESGTKIKGKEREFTCGKTEIGMWGNGLRVAGPDRASFGGPMAITIPANGFRIKEAAMELKYGLTAANTRARG